MDSLTSLRVFCTVAELKSFTAAADRLGMSPAMASKHVMNLEKRLATRLLNRTSRHVSMTETGSLYFTQARQMLEGLDEVEAAVSNVTVTPRGTLKLSAPGWFANPEFARLLADFQARYPDICFDIDLSGRYVNLVDEGFDLALRATTSERLDPGLIARPLTDLDFYLVASPDYLKRTGSPERLSELNGHALLLYGYVPYHGGMTLGRAGEEEFIRFKVVMESGSETMLYMAALQGMGVTFLPARQIEADVTAGRLEIVLPDLLQLGGTLFAVYPSRKYLSAKVRLFIDFLVEEVQRIKRERETLKAA
jgi:DNA-binding transcriptional LysR family regulator